jgi:dipeptidase E
MNEHQTRSIRLDGAKVRAARVRACLSRAQVESLSRAAGKPLALCTIKRAESSKPIYLSKASTLAEVLSVPVQSLLPDPCAASIAVVATGYLAADGKPVVVVALSGCGFCVGTHEEVDNSVLALISAQRPRVCFLPTASSDSPTAIERFYRRFSASVFEPWHLELTRVRPGDSAREVFGPRLLQQDLIYVGGGDTGDLLDVWQRHELSPLLLAAAQRGCVLAGVSAGAACWFQSFVTDCQGPELSAMVGLGLLSGSYCPHYDSEPNRRVAFHQLVKGGMLPGYAADDAVALRFVNGTLDCVFSASPQAHAYRVTRSADGEALEQRIG